ncbi:alanine/glycine:cation symporter family protein [Actinomyces vulturis]|uniref:alanine/glycine:cation symporter family protein n=1 Tax=Actinomyces vulturis TaxID=1857645 RepID=UPI001FDFA7A7|nr:alanine/glycine:cation symporter family protein [Actinomyces vulturis]
MSGTLQQATDVLDNISGHLYGQFLAWLLVAVGIYFTLRMRGVQFRLFGRMVAAITSSRDSEDAAGGISSFQAFAISLASRVGTGNIIGVAIALTKGGPGAVFWMWVVALLGMATAFVEATLAQMYKVPNPDGTFRGGPAYYITRGLGNKFWASCFAVVIIFVFGFAYEATQANAIAGIAKHALGLEPIVTAVILVLITAPIVFRGIRRVAVVTEWLAPIMALAYVLLAIVILIMHASYIPGTFKAIFESAFGGQQAFWGISGGFATVALNGIKRGLFSNEAGEGSVPNAAATASTNHPVQQGFVQSMGVFVDTIVVCTATALIILVSGVYGPDGVGFSDPGSLTSASVSNVLGGWADYLLALMIFVFAYSSLLGNYTYAEINADFLLGRHGIHAVAQGAPEGQVISSALDTDDEFALLRDEHGNLMNKHGQRLDEHGQLLTPKGKVNNHYLLRSMILVAAFIGSIASLDFVWNFSDVAMGLMAIINIIAISLLGKWAFAALKDWERQHKAVQEGRQAHIRFVAEGNDLMPGQLPGHVWSKEAADEAEALRS